MFNEEYIQFYARDIAQIINECEKVQNDPYESDHRKKCAQLSAYYEIVNIMKEGDDR